MFNPWLNTIFPIHHLIKNFQPFVFQASMAAAR
uniref:Uncharacterized protein n=1 Tax=Rhizophora mucronata TaxID=61149 RepID=A0A2P2Q6U4_RHIMU